MSKYSIIILLLLTACGTVYVPTRQVKTIYPNLTKCPELEQATQDNFVETIITNYGHYHQCKAQVDMMIDFIKKENK